MSEQVSISVVIPTYNAAPTIERALQALCKQHQMPLEIIVVDNGSSDDTVERVKSIAGDFPCDLRLLKEPRRGAAAARNCGVQAARGVWIAFTDSDCEPDKNWLSAGWELIENCGPKAMAGPAWGTMEGDSSAKVMGLMTLSVGMDEHWVSKVGAEGMQGFAAANLWVKRSLFQALNGFDVGLNVTGEDVDLCSRLYQKGEKILYSPDLRVNHIHQSGVANMFWKMVSYGRAHALLLERYGQTGLHTDISKKSFSLGSLSLSIHLRPADKKTLFLLLISLIWWPAIVLIALYILYIARLLRRRSEEIEHHVGWLQAYWMGCLLIVKSAGMTLGRVMGSRRRAWTF